MGEHNNRIPVGLRRIRLKRRLYLALIFAFVPACALFVKLDPRLALAAASAMFTGGLFIQHRLNKSKCPKCGDYFFVQTFSKGEYQPTSSLSFPPERKCQNCGLDLYRQ